MNLSELFDLAASRKASDIHLATGEVARLRIEGALVPLEEPLDLTAILEAYLTPEGRARLAAGLPAERTIVQNNLAFISIAFRTGDEGVAATFRVLQGGVPPFDKIMEGAETFFRRIAEAKRGFVLIVGPTGSGKWTTACTLVDTINAERGERIFVATMHPGYVFESKRGMVTQVRIGPSESLAGVLRMFHEADPDVLAMDDLPTHEDLRQALDLASMGHLVIANLHAHTPTQALERLLETAGDEASALRRALAENFVAVTAQRLLPRTGGGRVPVYEWIANGLVVREALLSGGDLAAVQVSDPDCRALGPAVRDLYMAGKISMEDAVRTAPRESFEGSRTEVRGPGAG